MFRVALVTAATMFALGASAHADDSDGAPADQPGNPSSLDDRIFSIELPYSSADDCNPPPDPPRDLGGYHLSAYPIAWVWCATPAMGTYVWTDAQRRLLPARDRTHRAWMVPAAWADPSAAVTTLEGGPRLAGAPGIPVGFLRGVEIQSLGVPISARAGSGGTGDILLRHGDPEVDDVRIVLDHDRGGSGAAVELLAGAPLTKRAALAVGLVLEPVPAAQLGAHGMAAIDYAPSPEHQLALLGIAQTTRDGLRDAWTSARWTARTQRGIALRAIATAEQLSSTSTSTVAATTTNRAGGQLDVSWRPEPETEPETELPTWRHELTLSASGGGGLVGRERHADAALAVGGVLTRDSEADVQLDVGVRAELRTIASERALVVAPRVALALFREPADTKLFNVFIAYQRVPHLDDGALGAWRELDALAHHETAIGGTFFRAGDVSLLFGASAIARSDTLAFDGPGRDLGAHVWFRLHSQRGGGTWPWLLASATTFGPVAAMTGQHRLLNRGLHRLVVGATARVDPERATGGVALQWWHLTAEPDIWGKLGVTLEVHAGDGERSARMIFELAQKPDR